jgi:heme-degrading monooxygenase HmoA
MTRPSPYYAVIFTTERTSVEDGYDQTAQKMVELAEAQPGFLGVDSARDESVGITVSYWDSLDSIADWKRHAEHLEAQEKGKSTWYRRYSVRIARVEREYEFRRDADGLDI